MSLVNLKQVIELAVESVRPTTTAKSIQLHVDLNAEVGSVRGDANRLQQVVWNLLSNAVKFTPPNGWVRVRLFRQSDSIVMQVEDSGIGMQADFLPHVFERFQQADSSKTRSYGGLGLGLSIVRHLTEMHGGQVQADSKGEGQGSTFTVLLPPSVDDGSDAQRQDIYPDESVLLQGKQILVVDDDPDTLGFVGFTLEQCGAVVHTAKSAQEAKIWLQQVQPNLIISDIGMPYEDGYMFIRNVQREYLEQQRALVPAIALTAYASHQDRQEALSHGYQEHLAKPVDPDHLVAVVKRLLQAGVIS
jgi:CheY-like chemotaxis protein/anti-sigma regulatory factor (Ser/Thr protein kinase)